MGLFKFLKEKFSKKDKTIEKYDDGLKSSRDAFTKKLKKISKNYTEANGDYFNELEEILIEADCGVSFTLNLIEELTKLAKKKTPNEINELLIDKIKENYKPLIEKEILIKPEILLVVGVNGVGKTTTIAKIAKKEIEKGKKVMLVAGDTFRAGAKDQLSIWGERLNCNVFSGLENEDPSSVIYKGIEEGKKNNSDLIIIDTAGRLQNKKNLMDELSKINRVINKTIDYEFNVYLIIDATTGQNGIEQARVFNEIIKIDAIVLTKMDGTSKGGIILPINNELHIPIKYIGLGESFDDLLEFDIDKYLYSLFGELIENE